MVQLSFFLGFYVRSFEDILYINFKNILIFEFKCLILKDLGQLYIYFILKWR